MSRHLHNWTGDLRWHPARIDRPATHDELAAVLRRTKQPIRVSGAGHSFSPLAVTDRQTIQTDRLSGLDHVAADRHEVTVHAGTRLRDLGRLIAEHGLALENQGDIDQQALAGALSTATHGTGTRLGCMASQVLELTMVTGKGDTLTLSREQDADLFRAAAVSLGSLGVISKVRLRVREAYRLHDIRMTLPLDECLAQIESLGTAHRHFEFLWFPWTDVALTRTLNIIHDDTSTPMRPRGRLAAMVRDNLAFWLTCQLGRLVPGRIPALNRFCALAAEEAESSGPSHLVFPTPRHVRFHEMEYAVPVASGPDCLREIREFIEGRNLPVSFPLYYRMVAQDDLFLSPFHGRDSVTISMMMFHPFEYHEAFDGVEAILRNHVGRPHWGKKHSAGPSYLRSVYPRWDDFLAVRAELDPTGRFLNAHLHALFEEACKHAPPCTVRARRTTHADARVRGRR